MLVDDAALDEDLTQAATAVVLRLQRVEQLLGGDGVVLEEDLAHGPTVLVDPALDLCFERLAGRGEVDALPTAQSS
jgi:hypothetical protein